MLAALALAGALSVGAAAASPADTTTTAKAANTAATPAVRLRPTPAQVLLFMPAPAARIPESVSEGAAAAAPVMARRDGDALASPDPQLIEYSDGYFTRLTIHKWASWLTVPLFVGQYAVGRKLINGEGTDRLRNIHGVLAGSIAGLFAVNTVTGGLNAIEAWKDPEGRNRRTLHTVLMLLADAGFVATGATAQENENEGGFNSPGGNNNTHRNVALASMGTALLGVAVMLPIFGR